MKARFYPENLEAFWREKGRPFSEKQLEDAAERLSCGFTTTRPEVFVDYLSDPLSLAAYGLFFHPQTFERCCHVLSELKRRKRFPKTIRILDAGAGLGAGLFAAAAVFKEHSIQAVALDHSRSALNCLEEQAGLFPNLSAATRSGSAATGLGDVPESDLTLISFALNEFSENTELIRRSASTGIVVILEPASEESHRRLRMLQKEFPVIAPCLQNTGCPFAGRDLGYCHDVRAWTPPESLSQINRHLLRSVQDVKYCYVILGEADPVQDESAFRLVAPMSRTKGRIVARGCFADCTLRGIEIQTRHLKRKGEDALVEIERGALLRPIAPKSIDDGRILRMDGVEEV